MPAHTHDGIDWVARLTDLRAADAANGPAQRAVATRLIESLPAPRPTVLDVGSGAGGMSAALAQALADASGGRLVLIDAVPELLASAAEAATAVAADRVEISTIRVDLAETAATTAPDPARSPSGRAAAVAPGDLAGAGRAARGDGDSDPAAGSVGEANPAGGVSARSAGPTIGGAGWVAGPVSDPIDAGGVAVSGGAWSVDADVDSAGGVSARSADTSVGDVGGMALPDSAGSVGADVGSASGVSTGSASPTVGGVAGVADSVGAGGVVVPGGAGVAAPGGAGSTGVDVGSADGASAGATVGGGGVAVPGGAGLVGGVSWPAGWSGGVAAGDGAGRSAGSAAGVAVPGGAGLVGGVSWPAGSSGGVVASDGAGRSAGSAAGVAGAGASGSVVGSGGVAAAAGGVGAVHASVGGSGGVPAADLVWASNVTHHLPDQRRGVDVLVGWLAPGGCLALAEGGLSMRCLPWDVGVGEPGLQDRLIAAHGTWFHRMRTGMDGVVRLPIGWNRVLADAGLSRVSSFSYLVDVPAPLDDTGRAAVVSWLAWMTRATGDLLQPADQAALGRLLDPADPAYVGRRDDVFLLKASTVYLGWRT